MKNTNTLYALYSDSKESFAYLETHCNWNGEYVDKDFFLTTDSSNALWVTPDLALAESLAARMNAGTGQTMNDPSFSWSEFGDLRVVTLSA